jgi:phosphate-selective porin OprO/OprP
VRYQGDPKNKCLCYGPGAWQAACRLSQVDLDDGSIAGGNLIDVTLGLNWYLNTYLRVTTNYIHAFSDDLAGADPNTDIFGMRVGYEF